MDSKITAATSSFITTSALTDYTTSNVVDNKITAATTSFITLSALTDYTSSNVVDNKITAATSSFITLSALTDYTSSNVVDNKITAATSSFITGTAVDSKISAAFFAGKASVSWVDGEATHIATVTNIAGSANVVVTASIASDGPMVLVAVSSITSQNIIFKLKANDTVASSDNLFLHYSIFPIASQ